MLSDNLVPFLHRNVLTTVHRSTITLTRRVSPLIETSSNCCRRADRYGHSYSSSSGVCVSGVCRISRRATTNHSSFSSSSFTTNRRHISLASKLHTHDLKYGTICNVRALNTVSSYFHHNESPPPLDQPTTITVNTVDISRTATADTIRIEQPTITRPMEHADTATKASRSGAVNLSPAGKAATDRAKNIKNDSNSNSSSNKLSSPSRTNDITKKRSVSPGGGDPNQSQVTLSDRRVANPTLKEHGYEFDYVVIGGGSGGLASAKVAAHLGAKVAVCDFVKPTPIGTAWGLGGTCVNVGCIPKKLMHQASQLRDAMRDARAFGWDFGADDTIKHNWLTMVTNIQEYIGSLNFKYRVQLREAEIQYFNSFAEFVEPHKLRVVNKRNQESFITSDKFLIAVGGRPRYPSDVAGALEHCISSDDIFSLKYPPGKTLCVGASYVALECGGFLHGCGFETEIMVRSILLRGFDQGMAERIGKYMQDEGVKFTRGVVPTRVEKIQDGEPPLLRVYARHVGQSADEPEFVAGEYNTVLLAIGRDACTPELRLNIPGVNINKQTGKIPSPRNDESTSAAHVFAVGDVLDGKPELTPVAIQAGKLLAERLFDPRGGDRLMDYINIPTTVFTPLEYGAVGYAEEEAIAKFGEENIEVFHTLYRPLEWALPKRADDVCYGKIICDKRENLRVIGFHVCGPNAGEMTQGYAVAMKCGATKKHFDDTIGIHPTTSEIFVTLDITRASGMPITQAAC